MTKNVMYGIMNTQDITYFNFTGDIMNILENQYIVPVFVGTCDETVRIARRLQKKTGIKANIFSNRFSFSQKLIFNCYKVSPFGDEWIKEALLDFSKRLEEYYCPVYIVCDEYSKKIADGFDEIGCAYLVVDKETLFSEDLRKGEAE